MAGMSLEETYYEMRRTVNETIECQAHLLGACKSQSASVDMWLKATLEEKREAKARALNKLKSREKRRNALTKKRVQDIVDELLKVEEGSALNAAEYIQIGSMSKTSKRDDLFTVPFIVPLLGHGNIVMSVSGEGCISDGVVREVEAKTLLTTSASQVEIISFDPALKNIEAPFSTIGRNGQGEAAVRYLHSRGELDALLNELTDRVTRINNELLSDDECLAVYHQRVGMPVEKYQLVVIHDMPMGMAAEQYDRVCSLMKAAPKAGTSFLMIQPKMDDLPKWYCEKKRSYPVSERLELFSGSHARWLGHDGYDVELYELDTIESTQAAERMARSAAELRLPEVKIESVLPAEYWMETSEDGVTFSLGLRGTQTVDVTIGSNETQRHNALITGAVGQGKSNLLKDIIYGLCARYSPDELELYLFDFKEGVTLFPMAPTLDSPEYLPQVKAFGLEADEDFAMDVLNSIAAEAKRRAAAIKPYGDNLLKYRRNSGNKMPRIVVVIDEFQLFLEGSRGKEACELLERIVRLYRAYGIHVILASQSIGGITNLAISQGKFFAQFPIRIGLKNSPAESRATFGPFNEAAASLRFRGQAILNEDYGNPSANVTVLTPFAEDATLDSLRNKFYAMSKEHLDEPVVFDGNTLPELTEALLEQSDIDSGNVPSALLGRGVSAGLAPIYFSFERAAGSNIALVGRGTLPGLGDLPNSVDLAACVMETLVLSLARYERGAEFAVVEDGARHISDSTLEICARAGVSPKVVPSDEAVAWIADCLQRNDVGEECRREQFVLVPNADSLGSFDFGAQQKIQKVFREAPMHGIHFVCHWQTPVALSAQLGSSGLSSFDGVACLFGSNVAAKQLDGPLCQWNGQENRVLYKEASSGRPSMKLMPFITTRLWRRGDDEQG